MSGGPRAASCWDARLVCTILSPNLHPLWMGTAPQPAPGGVGGWLGLNRGCLALRGAPEGLSWLLATNLNFPQAAVCSSSPPPPPQIQPAFLLSRTPKFLSWRCFKLLCKAQRITGSTMVVTLLAGAKDLLFFFLALESNLAVPCTAGI